MLDRAIAACTTLIERNAEPGERERAPHLKPPRRAQSDKREYDRALADYNEALRLVPNSVVFLVDRGNVWLNKKDPNRAFADFERAVMLEPMNAGAYNGRALAWWEKGDLRAAWLDLEQAAKLAPTDQVILRNRDNARIAYGNQARANRGGRNTR
jgi:tetratricopeptide (TPR) repeat protein